MPALKFDDVFGAISGFVRLAFSGLINLFTDERTGPFLAGVIIFFGALFVIYIVWAWARSFAVMRSSIAALRIAAGNDEADRRAAFAAKYTAIDGALLALSRVSHAWRAFRETLFLPDDANSTAGIVSHSTRPNAFFSVASLQMGFSFVRHIPNIFVGIGLLGTFLGLIAALTAALNSFSANGDPRGAQEAIQKLLTTASAKFYVSAAALSVSIVLTILIRAFSNDLSRRVSHFNQLLEERLLFLSAENIAGQQLALVREQSIQLRTFNTDLAMTIGQSVRDAVTDSNGALIKQLQGIAETFSQLVEASRQGAGAAISKAVDDTITGCVSACNFGSDSFLMKLRRRLALVSQGESMPCNLFELQR